jgi:hypothetical protein
MVAALGVAVVLCTVVACGHEESATPRLSETSHPTSAPNAAPSVELLEPGAEPRETLRFKLTEGAQFRATMTTEMAIDIEIDGEKMPASTVPPTLIDMTAAVRRVAPNGDVDYTFTMEKFRVGDGTVLPPAAQRTFDQLDGVTGQAAMKATGESTKFDLDMPPDLDPQMRSMLDGMSSQLAKTTAPFPTEPIGTGARWRTTASAELNGLRTDLTTTYTLRERTGDRYLTDVSYEQSAPEQDAELPGLPPGVRAHVDNVAISGSGEIEGSLSLVFPVTSRMQGGGTMDMSVDDGQSSADMHQTLDMTIGVESVP